ITSQLVLQQAQAAAGVQVDLPPAKYANAADYTYHIAPQDILGVTVYDHPEISTPQGSTFSQGGNTTQTVGQTLTQPYTNALSGES
ncbi:exopolysaccharide biosynthesis protein, partial [Burkholderia sp. SIMBA_019]